MCKILCVAGVQPEVSKDLLWKFLIAATPPMSAHDQDGLGYASMGRTGIWGERWVNPKDAWDYRTPWTKDDDKISKTFKGLLESEPKYNCFGTADPEETTAVLLHTRTATSPKGMQNTHPFVRDNVALIHNGVIRNTEALKNITSTCDSECILNEYFEANVMANPAKIKEVAKNLQGYYACGVLGYHPKGTSYLDLFREGAPIYAYKVKELGAMVFCTSDEIIRSAAKSLKLTLGNSFKVKENVLIRINAATGELMAQEKFSPWTWQSSNSSYEYGSNGKRYNNHNHGTEWDQSEGKWVPVGTLAKAEQAAKAKESLQSTNGTSSTAEAKESGTSTNLPSPLDEGLRAARTEDKGGDDDVMSDPFYGLYEGYGRS